MMETFDLLYEGLVVILDYPLGWMLFLGRDLSITVLAAGTAIIMLLLRKRVTNQEMLKRCSEDRATLKRRAREAKAKGDKATAKRLKMVSSMISIRTLGSEGKPLLASLIPIILLASWAYARLGHVPSEPGSVIQVSADLAPKLVDRPVYLLPQEGVSAPNGWIQLPVAEEAWDGVQVARATWDIRLDDALTPIDLPLRAGAGLNHIRVQAGGRRYPTPERWLYGEYIRSINIHLEERRLFGIIPGIPAIAIPPWLLAYLLLAIPSYFIFKKVLRVY